MKRNAEDGENAEEDAEPGLWGKQRVFSCFSVFLIKKRFIVPALRSICGLCGSAVILILRMEEGRGER